MKYAVLALAAAMLLVLGATANAVDAAQPAFGRCMRRAAQMDMDRERQMARSFCFMRKAVAR